MKRRRFFEKKEVLKAFAVLLDVSLAEIARAAGYKPYAFNKIINGLQLEPKDFSDRLNKAFSILGQENREQIEEHREKWEELGRYAEEVLAASCGHKTGNQQQTGAETRVTTEAGR